MRLAGWLTPRPEQRKDSSLLPGGQSNTNQRMKNLIRSMRFFRPDYFRIILVQAFMVTGIAFNILKPWPLALIVDGVLGNKPLPKWMPAGWGNLDQAGQLAVLVFVLLGVHL